MLFGLPQRRHIASVMKDQGRAIIDIAMIVCVLVPLFLLIRSLDLFEKLYVFTRHYEQFGLDEVFIVVLFSVVGLILFGARRLQDQRREIKARRAAEDRAQHLALADALTGLA